MKKKSISREEILKELKNIHQKDYKYSDGKILGSMCTEAHPFAKEVYSMFFDTNLGDYGLFKGTKYIEDEVISMIGKLLSLNDAFGHIVTGGTEANIMSMRAARNHARKYKNITDGEIIIPKSAHFSFKKAADILNLKIIEVDLNNQYKMDINSVEELITEKTIAIVGVAGTTELGLIDSIEELSNIALKYDIYLHVDAAFGGFSIPFLKKIGHDLPNFDFSLPGVCSITVDPHKMGRAPIPAGGIIFRKKEFLDVMAVEVPYLTIKNQSTIVGTRIGASSAATYAIMKHLGEEGYCNLVEELMMNTSFLYDKLEEMGYVLTCRPELNIVSFNHPKIDPHDFAQKLDALGWKVSVSKIPAAIRIVLMPHVKLNDLIELVHDLKMLY